MRRENNPISGLSAASIAALAVSDTVRYSLKERKFRAACDNDHDRTMSHSIATSRRIFPAGSYRWTAAATAIAIVVLVIDALSKWLVVQSLGPGNSRRAVRIVGDFLEFRFGRNSGLAFGLLSGSSTVAALLVGAIILPLTVVLLILAGRGLLWSLGAGLVLGGALGNLVDRIGDQTVTDFISVGRWPSFNLADAAITVGALVLIGLSFLDRDAPDMSQ